jgi:hypothetical protein
MKTGIPKKIETDENHAALVSYGVAPSVELPLTPMSETAGRMAVQEGAKHLGSLHGVCGILFSCVPGVSPAIHVNPAFSVDGIVHNGVAHMPGGGAAHRHACADQCDLALCAAIGEQGMLAGAQGIFGTAEGSQHQWRESAAQEILRGIWAGVSCCGIHDFLKQFYAAVYR